MDRGQVRATGLDIINLPNNNPNNNIDYKLTEDYMKRGDQQTNLKCLFLIRGTLLVPPTFGLTYQV